MPTPLRPAYADSDARLLAARALADAAYLRHATHPNHSGADVAFERAWAAWYESKAALAERNPAYADTLLPATGAGVNAGEGLPLLPAAVRWAVDESGPNTVRLTMDVAGGVSVSVLPPTGAAFLPPVTLAPTRATTVFAAPADGLYLVTLTAAGTTLARVYVPVTRRGFGLLREDSRHLRQQFRLAPNPRPTDTMRLRLALLRGAECAAQSGQPTLALSLLARVRGLGSHTPALYPEPRP